MKNAMEQLSVCRDIPVAGMHGMQRHAAPEKRKLASPLHRCASCPCFGANGPGKFLQVPCTHLQKTLSAVLHQDHYRHPLCMKTSQKVSNSCHCRLMSQDKDSSSMMQHISNVCTPCCAPCAPRCGPCCSPLPAPCNTPPRCVQYMTGYYYYPYGFWFCGPYHVTGTCVPGGPVAPGGPCGPCCPNPGGPCGPCNPGCICGVLNTLAVMPTCNQRSNINLMPSEQAMSMLDITKIKLPFNMNSLPMNCLPLYASAKGGGGRNLPSGPLGAFGVCGPCCGCGGCGPGCAPCCGGKGPCGPCGPQGPFGPCGPCFPGVGCGCGGFSCCGPSRQCCLGPGCCCNGCCGGMCVGPCGGCGPFCGNCGPCGCGCGCGCGPCGCGCGPCGCGCGPCGCGCGSCGCGCGPCGPLCGPCGCGACGCGPCGCGSCLPFGCGACCGVAPCLSSSRLCPPTSPPLPPPSTTGQWSGPCVNCKCTRPIPVNDPTLGSSAGTTPFTQCCLAIAADKLDVAELRVCPTCTSTSSSEEVKAPLTPILPKKSVSTVQPPNRPGSRLTMFHRHPGYNEAKQLTERPKPMVNTILTCYQSTLTGTSSLRAKKAINDDSMPPKQSCAYDESFPTVDEPRYIIPTYDKPSYVPNDVEREMPSSPNCFTNLNAYPRCASEVHDFKVPTGANRGLNGLRGPWPIACDSH